MPRRWREGGKASNGPPPMRRVRIGEVERGGVHAISVLGPLVDGAGGLLEVLLARMIRGNVGECDSVELEGKEEDE
jgi:hypothetical protein